MSTIGRRAFLASGSVGLASAAALGTQRRATARLDDAFAIRVPSERVNDFVGACHARIDDVRAMLGEDPGLGKAAWDWGFGDWETAIGACSHTGRKDIIELLLTHGARPDVFTFATLDDVDAVRAFIERVPGARAVEGPHSITIFRHALAGNAERVKNYLAEVGLDDDLNHFQTDPGLARSLTGTFGIANDRDQRFEIGWFERLSCLTLATSGEASRNLMPIEASPGDTPDGRVFRPAGSAGARVSFPTPDRLVLTYLGRTVEAGRVG